MMRSKRCTWGWTIGLGVTVAALLWLVDPAGAIPLESWDDKIPRADTRFKVLTEFGGAAVLDKETQLVWERYPSVAFNTWFEARPACLNLTVGRRKGWRLPTIAELASLVDPSVPFPGPTLPPGHPFNFELGAYWSASTDASSPADAWLVAFDGGSVAPNPKAVLNHVWCVRGGLNQGSEY